jgi:hypothetical protein
LVIDAVFQGAGLHPPDRLRRTSDAKKQKRFRNLKKTGRSWHGGAFKGWTDRKSGVAAEI